MRRVGIADATTEDLAFVRGVDGTDDGTGDDGPTENAGRPSLGTGVVTATASLATGGHGAAVVRFT